MSIKFWKCLRFWKYRCFKKVTVIISTQPLKSVLLLQFALHFYIYIYFWLFHFFGWPLKNTQEKIFPNFFSKIATESGLLSHKISLWYFSNLQVLHLKKIKKKHFSGRTVEFHFVLNIAKKPFGLINFLIEWSWKPKTVSFYV